MKTQTHPAVGYAFAGSLAMNRSERNSDLSVNRGGVRPPSGAAITELAKARVFSGTGGCPHVSALARGALRKLTITVITLLAALNNALHAGPPQVADLAVTCSGPGGFIPLETKVEVTITVANFGPDSAGGVFVTNTLTPGVEVTDVALSQGSYSYANNQVICSLGTLAMGATVNLVLSVVSAPPLDAGVDTCAGSPATDPQPNNNVATTILRFGTRDLAVTLSDAPDPLTAGQFLTNTIVVTNRSADSMPGAMANLLVPGAMRASAFTVTRGSGTVAPAGDSFDWQIGALAGHEAVTAKVVCQALDAGTWPTTVEAFGNLFEPDFTNNSSATDTEIRSGPGALEFAQATVSESEAAGSVKLTVRRRGGSAGSVSVGVLTEDGTAGAPADYRSRDEQITFADGETEQEISVTLADDSLNESNECFYVNLHHAQGGAVLGGIPVLTFVIEENDLPPHGWITAASVTPGAVPVTGNLASVNPALSADGCWVLFTSTSTDLVPDDINGQKDLFLRCIASGQTRLVDVTPAGTNSAGFSFPFTAALNADGSRVVFESDAADLVRGDTNGCDDVFLWDRHSGTNQLISVNASGAGPGNGPSDTPLITPDGRFVVFSSMASDLATGDANAVADLFRRDTLARVTTLISANASGTGSGTQASSNPTMSTNGHFVAFASLASDLVAGDGNGFNDVFLRNVPSATTTLVSINHSHTAAGNERSSYPVISPNGRYVAYLSRASDLVAGDTNGVPDLFLYDRLTGSNRLACAVSSLAATPVFSADSRFLAFATVDSRLATNDLNGANDVFLLNVTNLAVTLVSANGEGSSTGNGASSTPAVSASGGFVTFQSTATDLAPGSYVSSKTCVFLRDVQAGVTHLLSRRWTNHCGPDESSRLPAINADGTVVAFESKASDLVPNDINTVRDDVFLWTLTEPRPWLAIACTNNLMRVSWPTSAAGWVLERTNTLRTTASPWPPVPPPYTTNDGVISVTVTNVPPTGNRFYRLHKP